MNAILKQDAGIPALAMTETELLSVLESSLYPGASPESIKLVIQYCKASGLDPLRKPVHIVPMWDSKSSRMRDVIMPGVGSYRTDAARTGQCAGVSEPEFGPDITENLGGASITYPTYCRVTVKRRLPSGEIAEYTAVERWKENYAPRGGKEKSIAPNTMWAKRPYAQLAKCSEAQALRKAFPEVGAQATADEMEGKALQPDDVIEGTVTREALIKIPAALPEYSDDALEQHKDAWASWIATGKSTADDIIIKVQSKYALTDAQKDAIRNLKVDTSDFNDFFPEDLGHE